jgi:hypothetical protein
MKRFFIFIITGILWGNNFPGFKSTWKIEGIRLYGYFINIFDLKNRKNA